MAAPAATSPLPMHKHKQLHTHTHTHAYLHTPCICVHPHIHVHLHTCTNTHTYTCTCTHTAWMLTSSSLEPLWLSVHLITKISSGSLDGSWQPWLQLVWQEQRNQAVLLQGWWLHLVWSGHRSLGIPICSPRIYCGHHQKKCFYQCCQVVL